MTYGYPLKETRSNSIDSLGRYSQFISDFALPCLVVGVKVSDRVLANSYHQLDLTAQQSLDPLEGITDITGD